MNYGFFRQELGSLAVSMNEEYNSASEENAAKELNSKPVPSYSYIFDLPEDYKQIAMKEEWSEEMAVAMSLFFRAW